MLVLGQGQRTLGAVKSLPVDHSWRLRCQRLLPGAGVKAGVSLLTVPADPELVGIGGEDSRPGRGGKASRETAKPQSSGQELAGQWWTRVRDGVFVTEGR